MKNALIGGLSLVAALSANAYSVTATNDANTLTNAVQATSSGINVLSSSVKGSATQVGTYEGFNLAPTSGSSPVLSLPNGVVLTSGTAVVPLTNTMNPFNGLGTDSAGLTSLSTLSGFNTFDAAALNLTFSVGAGITSVKAQFVFGTDEFPTQHVTDIFGFFVDGVNYAKFPGGELISNTPGNPTNFISNPVGSDLYHIEYNGLTKVFTVEGLLNTNLAEHTLQIAIADTQDTIFQSGVYIGGLQAGTATGGNGGGGITPSVPEPSTYALILAGAAVVGFASRRKKA